MPTATKPAPKPKSKSTLDYLQQALDDLDKARAQAQVEARTNIDAAAGRIRDAATELRTRASEPARELEERLEQVSEDARRELGKMVIQAQRSPEALTELAAEMRRRKRALSA
jgi:DNA anti-recombination protein RmuC